MIKKESQLIAKQRAITLWTVLLSLVIVFLAGCSIFTGPDKDVVATPTFDPPSGAYAAGQTVTILCSTPGASIYYSIDGSAPTLLYAGPVAIPVPCTLKAVATRPNWKDSVVASATYTITMPGDMVYVAGGAFNNGTSNVTIGSFYLDTFELTQSRYQAVMGVNPSHFTGVSSGPVERVTWFNAIEYSNRRSLQEGLTPCYNYSTYGANPDNWPAGWNTDYNNHANVSCNWTVNGYRLPTEMEWMFAARGGIQSHGFNYSGSDDIDAVAWYYNNSGYTTHTVGTKAPNELGIYDMSGNVWEWCWDIFGSYPSGPQTNPHGAVSGSTRVLRGGGWYSYADYCTVGYRNYDHATYTGDSFGFRVCRISP